MCFSSRTSHAVLKLLPHYSDGWMQSTSICTFSFLLSSFQLSLIWCNNCWNQSGFNAAFKSWLIPEKQPPRVGRSTAGQLPPQSRVSAADLQIFYHHKPTAAVSINQSSTITTAESSHWTTDPNPSMSILFFSPVCGLHSGIVFLFFFHLRHKPCHII